MPTITDKSAISGLNIQALYPSSYPAGNLAGIAAEVRASDNPAYRDLFTEVETQGTVPHDASIIGPAAYFADLLRMVIAKESETPDLPDTRKLKSRRLDLWSIPLDAENTTAEQPYLALVNKILAEKLTGQAQADGTRAQVLSTASGHIGAFDQPAFKARHALAAAKVDGPALLRRLGAEDAARAAALGVTVARHDVLCDFDAYRDCADLPNFPDRLAEVIASEDTTGLRDFALRYGVDPDVLAAYVGADCRTGPGGAAILAALVDAPQGRGFPFCFSDNGKGLALTYYGRDTDFQPAEGSTPARNPRQVAITMSTLAELHRLSALAAALGWSGRDFMHLLDGFLASSGPDRMAMLDGDDVDRLALVRAIQTRFNLTLAQTELLFCFADGPERLDVDGKPGLFVRAFPWPSGDARYQPVAPDEVPTWLTAATGLTAQVIGRIFGHHQKMHPDTAQIAITDAAIMTPLRYARLAEMFGMPVTDILSVAHTLSLPLGACRDMIALIDALDAIKAIGLPAAQVMAMVQISETATCAPADLKAAGIAIAAACPQPDPPATEDKAFRDNRFKICVAALAELWGMDAALVRELIRASMDKGAVDDFLSKATSGHYSELDLEDDLESGPDTVGFSNLQSALMVARAFGLDKDDVNFCTNNLDTCLPASGPHGWRSFESVKIWHAIARLTKASGIRAFVLFDLLAQCVDEADADGGAPTFDAEVLDGIAARSGLSGDALAAFWPFASDGSLKQDADPVLAYLAKCQTLTVTLGKLGVSLADARGLIDVFGDTSDGAPEADWPDRAAISDRIALGAQGRVGSADGPAMRQATHGACLEAERDALCARLLFHNGTDGADPSASWPWPLQTKADVSDMLLVDVEMTAAALISPIKLGLNTLQRYIQRVNSNQEADPRPFTLDKTQWTWRAHYRLWEANRKVFLYPENYLDPNLRIRKTPLYAEMEDALLQGEITEDRATQVYLDYLDKLQALSKLEIISACAPLIHRPGATTGDRTVLMLGRAPSETAKFYLRSCIFTEIGSGPARWTPWEEVTLPVQAEKMTVAVVNNRPHLFWVEVQEVADRKGDVQSKAFYATVKFAHKTLAGGWTQPASVDGFVHAPIATMTAQANRSWEATPTLGDDRVVFPSDDPQIRMTLSFNPVDTAVGGRHPRISAILRSEDDLVGVEERLGQPTSRLPGAADWAYAFYGPKVWAESNAPQDVIPNVTASTVIRCHAIAAVPNSDVVLGVFEGERADGRRLLRSADMGRGWAIAQNGMAPRPLMHDGSGEAKDMLDRLVIAERSGDVYSIAGWNPVLIYRSQDVGLNWTAVALPEGMNNWVDLAVSPDGRRLALIGHAPGNGHWDGDANNVLFTSRDAGTTWVKDTALYQLGSPTKRLPVNVVFDRVRGYLVIRSYDGDIYISHADGEWSMTSRESAPYDGALTASLDGVIRVTSGPVLFESRDGGETFAPCPAGPLPEPIHRHELVGNVPVVYQSGDVLQPRTDGSVGWMRFGELPNDWVYGGYNDVSQITQVAPGRYLFGRRVNGLGLNLPRWTVGGDLAHPGDGCLQWSLADPKDGFHGAYVHTGAPARLAQILVTHGMDRMLSLDTQTVPLDIGPDGPNSVAIDLDASAAYSIYFREIFFHGVMLIADTLNRHKKYKEARDWLHHVFCPDLIGVDTGGDVANPFWRYKKFRDYTLRHLKKFEDEEYRTYEEDPFDAHAVAAIRLGAYEKSVVMRYIDNLLDWADDLFAQSNWEAITEAMGLYSRAKDLLGPDPARHRHGANLPAPLTFEAFAARANAPTTPADTFHISDREVFPIPPNTEFETYWTRTREQMAKIRASQDADGVTRQLALFQPPIDPRRIMAAMAEGMSLGDAVHALLATPPRHRFETLLRSAREVTSTVVSFGAALLTALERKDAEGLAALRGSQERNLMQMTGRLRDMAIDDAQRRLDQAMARRSAAQAQLSHVNAMIAKKLLPAERASQRLTNDALALQSSTAAVRAASAPGYLTPSIFGMADGGQNIGRAIEVAASAIDSTAAALQTSAGISAVQGANDRRDEDWHWQAAQAHAELTRLESEIDIAKAAQDRAVTEQAMHRTQMDQHDAKRRYVEDKFTNQQLYGWMVGQLSALYKNGFNLALDFARQAEAAYMFETGKTQPILTQGQITGLRGALLMGQDLQLALAQLEKAWRDSQKTQLEAEKIISLKYSGLDPAFGDICADWTELKDKGVVEFTIPEKFLAMDGLGDGYRRIRSISLTLPSVAAPYQNLSAVLTQLSSQGANGKPLPEIAGQPRRVAISRAVRDHGVFDLDFRGPTYQPFEGTGAESTWRLQVFETANSTLLATLSDVVVHLRYVVH